MCGIVGTISRSKRADLADAVAALRHRGPDAGGIATHDSAGWRVQLGHRRLSILDLTFGANQPFESACGNYVIVFNGEIYNHGSLRDELSSAGVKFRTRSDTEVLLAGIALQGLEFLTKLNGMFAFVVFDNIRKRLILARDPFGIKPLYLHRSSDGGLTFASELRSLMLAAELPLAPDSSLFSEFLLNGFLYEPSSGFVGVSKVPPGCVYEFDFPSGRLECSRYYTRPAPGGATLHFDELLEQQVSLEMDADVRVGVFFSGGIDSSVLVAAAPRAVEAFFVDYGEGQGGDAHHVAAIAAALNAPLTRTYHREAELTAQNIVDEFVQVALGTEEPISDYTYMATRAISRCARDAGFKVMLSGVGGDELFAGYPRHLAAHYWKSIRSFRGALRMSSGLLRFLPSWDKRADRLKSFLGAPDFAEAYTSLIGYFSSAEVSEMMGTASGSEASLERIRSLLLAVSDETALRQAIFLDRQGFLAHNLTVTDKASMAESIEVRVPFLTPALERFALSRLDSELMLGRSGKRPLKAYLARWLSADQVHRPKVAFNPPLDRRIQTLGRGLCEELVTTGTIAQYIDPQVSRRWVHGHFDGEGNHTYRLWQLIYFRMWLDQFKRSAM